MVPRLGQVEGSEAVDRRDDVLHLHAGHPNAPCTLGDMAPSGPQLSPGPGGRPGPQPLARRPRPRPRHPAHPRRRHGDDVTVQRSSAAWTAPSISVSWVMNGYNLVLTVLFLTMGRLGDRYGHKLVFTLGLAVFTAASLPAPWRAASPELVAWRVVQAVGAAAVVPTALALLLQAFPAGRQGFAAGLFGAAQLAAAAVGPVLGGVLIERWGWPAIFWLNLPVGALGVVLALTLTRGRRTPRTRAPLDWPGVGLGSAGLFCLTLALIQGNDWGWTSRRRPRSLRRRRRPARRLGRGGSSARPLPLFDLAPLPRPHLRRGRPPPIMTVDTAMMGTMFMLRDLHDRDDGLQRSSRPASRSPPSRSPACSSRRSPAASSTASGRAGSAVTGALLSAAGLFALGHLARTDAARRRALAQRPRRRRPRPLAAGATAAGMSVVPGGHQGRRLGHAEHGPPARLPARGRRSSWPCSRTPWARP